MTQESKGFFYNVTGNPTRKKLNILKYASKPERACLLYPYIYTKTEKFIEIHNSVCCSLIQILPLCQYLESVKLVDSNKNKSKRKK